MSIFEKITSLLVKHGAKFEIFEHEPILTIEDMIKIQKDDPKNHVKSLIFMADKRPMLLVVRGDRRVNSNVFKKLLKLSDFRLATEDEVKRTTGLEVGAIPPFGNIFDIKIYLDDAILERDSLIFCAGDPAVSIRMKTKDYKNIVNPTIASFT